jgi:hypothetical protein
MSIKNIEHAIENEIIANIPQLQKLVPQINGYSGALAARLESLVKNTLTAELAKLAITSAQTKFDIVNAKTNETPVTPHDWQILYLNIHESKIQIYETLINSTTGSYRITLSI